MTSLTWTLSAVIALLLVTSSVLANIDFTSRTPPPVAACNQDGAQVCAIMETNEEQTEVTSVATSCACAQGKSCVTQPGENGTFQVAPTKWYGVCSDSLPHTECDDVTPSVVTTFTFYKGAFSNSGHQVQCVCPAGRSIDIERGSTQTFRNPYDRTLTISLHCIHDESSNVERSPDAKTRNVRHIAKRDVMSFYKRANYYDSNDDLIDKRPAFYKRASFYKRAPFYKQSAFYKTAPFYKRASFYKRAPFYKRASFYKRDTFDRPSGVVEDKSALDWRTIVDMLEISNALEDMSQRKLGYPEEISNVHLQPYDDGLDDKQNEDDLFVDDNILEENEDDDVPFGKTLGTDNLQSDKRGMSAFYKRGGRGGLSAFYRKRGGRSSFYKRGGRLSAFYKKRNVGDEVARLDTLTDILHRTDTESGFHARMRRSADAQHGTDENVEIMPYFSIEDLERMYNEYYDINNDEDSYGRIWNSNDLDHVASDGNIENQVLNTKGSSLGYQNSDVPQKYLSKDQTRDDKNEESLTTETTNSPKQADLNSGTNRQKRSVSRFYKRAPWGATSAFYKRGLYGIGVSAFYKRGLGSTSSFYKRGLGGLSSFYKRGLGGNTAFYKRAFGSPGAFYKRGFGNTSAFYKRGLGNTSAFYKRGLGNTSAFYKRGFGGPSAFYKRGLGNTSAFYKRGLGSLRPFYKRGFGGVNAFYKRSPEDWNTADKRGRMSSFYKRSFLRNV